MVDNTSGANGPQGLGWNSEAPALDGISCKEASEFMNSMVAGFRSLCHIENPVELCAETAKFLLQVAETAHSLKANEDPRLQELADKAATMGLVSLGHAVAALAHNAPPISLANLTENAINMLADYSGDPVKAQKLKDSHLLFKVRPSLEKPGTIEIGAGLVPLKPLESEIITLDEKPSDPSNN